MKSWPLLIGVIVILAILSSPVLAISKSDIISNYLTKTPTIPTTTFQIPSRFVPSHPAFSYHPSVSFTFTPTAVPTRLPTGTGTGTIVVGAHPHGAMVYLDGTYKGVTPVDHGELSLPICLELTGIYAGSHLVRVTKEGYQDYNTSITVIEGETTFVDATLIPISGPSPETGTISVTSTPEIAMVCLDGVHTGITPLTIPEVPEGLHRLKVTKTGYLDSIKWVVVRSDRITGVEVTLKVQTGSGTTPIIAHKISIP